MKDKKNVVSAWIEAARPKTLAASISPVLLGVALAYYDGAFDIVPAILCLGVALFAQIASNFANDYFDFKKGDLEGVVNYILRMDGIRFAALLSERQDKVRMSFRSLSPKVDVNKFAAKYWEGGGHVQAAGGTSSFGLELTCVFLEQQIEKCLYDKV